MINAVVQAINAKPVTPEACRVVAEIVEQYARWTQERIGDYEAMPHRVELDAKVDTLVTAQRNLNRIVAQITGIKD